VNIGSATANTYVLVTADIGKAIDCVVTATNDGGSDSADSNDITLSAFLDAVLASAEFDLDDGTLIDLGNPVGEFMQQAEQHFAEDTGRAQPPVEPGQLARNDIQFMLAEIAVFFELGLQNFQVQRDGV